MKTLTILLFCFVFPYWVTAQQMKESYHSFEAKDTSYLLADRVNVRNQASSKSKVIANIPIGTMVIILKKTEQKLTLNGFESNWYEVQFGDQKGYIWGGLIADSWDMAKDDPQTIFLFGIASAKEVKYEWGSQTELKMQMRAAKNDTQLSKIEFEGLGGLNILHHMQTTDNKGLSSIDGIIYFSVSQPMCGGINGDVVIFWDNQKLHYVTTLRPGSDAPMFATDDLIFPTDKGGVKGKIIAEQIVGEYDEEKQKDIIQSQYKAEYTWTGSVLKKVKTLINKK